MAAEKRPEPKAIEEFQSTPRAAQFSYGAGAEPPNIAGHAAVAEPKREGPAKTFHDFTGQPTVQIDWILYRGVKANAVRVLTTSKDGRYPSDHFPIAADFTL